MVILPKKDLKIKKMNTENNKIIAEFMEFKQCKGIRSELGKYFDYFRKRKLKTEENMYTKEQLIKAIQLARLGILNNEVIDYQSISGLTEICTYDLKEAYTDEEIVSKVLK